jgi:addiction module RelE/StbE family toxin
VVQVVEWTKRALSDLRDIYDFIEKDSKKYAQIQIEKIQNSVSLLKLFPSLGHTLPEFPNSPYREILVGNYRIIYRFDDQQNTIFVMSVIHVKRLLKDIQA